MARLAASLIGLACLAGCAQREGWVAAPVPDAWMVGDESLVCLRHRLAVAAANLANMDTPGYKPLIVIGKDSAGQPLTEVSFVQGRPMTAERSLDILLTGPGFLRVQADEGGYIYTRDGRLTRNADGEIVLAQGPQYRLEPTITVPPEAVSIIFDRDGLVSITDPRGETVEIGQIEVYGFVNPGGLRMAGTVHYVETAASGEPIMLCGSARPAIQQYSYEGSAVDPVREQREIERVCGQLPLWDRTGGALTRR